MLDNQLDDDVMQCNKLLAYVAGTTVAFVASWNMLYTCTCTHIHLHVN